MAGTFVKIWMIVKLIIKMHVCNYSFIETCEKPVNFLKINYYFLVILYCGKNGFVHNIKVWMTNIVQSGIQHHNPNPQTTQSCSAHPQMSDRGSLSMGGWSGYNTAWPWTIAGNLFWDFHDPWTLKTSFVDTEKEYALL